MVSGALRDWLSLVSSLNGSDFSSNLMGEAAGLMGEAAAGGSFCARVGCESAAHSSRAGRANNRGRVRISMDTTEGNDSLYEPQCASACSRGATAALLAKV